MADRPRVLFIGIGKMGWPMAVRLSGAGFPLSVADADAGRVAEFNRVTNARGPSAKGKAAADADIVVTMLPNSEIVAQVLFGADGIAPHLGRGVLLVEMSSGVPSATRKIADQLLNQGCGTVDAPVSGGVPRAETGELAIMVGGEEKDIAAETPVLSALGTSIVRTGGTGSAHAMKALNNLVSAAGLLASIEGVLIGKRFGLNPDTMVDILNVSTGMNNSTQKKVKQFILSRRFSSGYGLDLMLKDLTIALDIAKETSTPAPFSALCRELTAACAQMLGAGHDHTELTKLSEALAGDRL
jgi:3-hydroxyisobutyrate dehydrogenase